MRQGHLPSCWRRARACCGSRGLLLGLRRETRGGPLSRPAEQPLLAVSSLGRVPSQAEAASPFLHPHPWTGAHLCAGCLPLWLAPQSHSAPLHHSFLATARSPPKPWAGPGKK